MTGIEEPQSFRKRNSALPALMSPIQDAHNPDLWLALITLRPEGLTMVVIGLGLIAIGLTGEEFYPGHSQAHEHPMPKWLGRVISIGSGVSLLCLGAYSILR